MAVCQTNNSNYFEHSLTTWSCSTPLGMLLVAASWICCLCYPMNRKYKYLDITCHLPFQGGNSLRSMFRYLILVFTISLYFHSGFVYGAIFEIVCGVYYFFIFPFCLSVSGELCGCGLSWYALYNKKAFREFRLVQQSEIHSS